MRQTTNIPTLTRRDALRLGALTITGFGLEPHVGLRPLKAQSRVKPRGSADCVIFLNLQGGPSQMDTFDVKEGKWAPGNRDVRTVKQGYQFPVGLMPKLVNHLDELAVVRSMEAWETVHSRGQYYLQTGHAVSPARLKESPAMGAVIAYETLARRKDSDFLPPFVAMNYEATTMYGPLQREGCLPSDCSPLVLDLKKKELPFALEEKDKARFARRWQALQQTQSGAHAVDANAPEPVRQYESFGRAVNKMMTNPAIGEVMRFSPEEHQAYGATPFGDACLIARNMASANAGARMVLVTHPGWDQHSNIYGKEGKGGIYKLCSELDAAMSGLLFDLKRMKNKQGERLLDKTFVVCMGEFGRTPGDLTMTMGREHYAKAMVAAFAGAGVSGGRALGSTDSEASKIASFDWKGKRPIYMEDVCATIYSTLGIDWTKRIRNTPSGRDFVYVDPAAGTGVVDFTEVSDLFAS